MGFFDNYRGSRWFWILLLAGGLVLESCLLAAGVSFWMSRNGFTPGVGEKPVPTQVAVNPDNDGNGRPTDIQQEEQPDELTATVPSTTETPLVTPSPSAEPVEFTTPPPGKIVYTCFDGSYDQICLMNADGSEKRQLTEEKATNFYPSLSVDGNQIVFSSNRDGNFEVYMMDTQGRNLVQLTNNLGNTYAPAISPKGNRIVFTLASGNSQDIWVMRIDGGNPRPFTAMGSAIDPSWSPDGRFILFTARNQGVNSLYIMEAADGSKPQRVTGRDLDVSGRNDWAPDGSQLAFYAGSNGAHEIYTVEIDGENLQQWTNGGDNLGPSFSPDGAWIAYTSFRTGNNDIFVLNLEEGQSYQVTFDSKSDWQPRWGP